MKLLHVILLIILCISFQDITAQGNSKTANLEYVSENDENEAKVYELANAIEASIHQGKSDEYVKYWSKKAFGQRVKDKMEITKSDDFIEGFLEGANKGLERIPNELIAQYNDDAYYDFVSLRYEILEQTYYMLFRFYSDDEGINYHDYRVCIVDGAIMFSDIYIYLSGEHVASTVARLGLSSIPKKSFKNLFGLLDKKVNTEGLSHLVKAKQYANSGDFKKAYEELLKTDGDLKNDKFFLMMKSQYALGFDIEIYKSAMEEMIKMYPHDSTLHFQYIDYYTALEDYDKALGYLNNLEQETGDDFLKLMKANLYYYKGDTEQAIENYQYIIDNYDYFYAYSCLLTIRVEKEEYDSAVGILSSLINSGYDKDTIIEFVEEDDENGENILAPLMKTEVYKKWKKEKN